MPNAMTITVDKRQIHLGWPTAGAIILFLVTTIWGASWSVQKFLDKQDKIYNVVMSLRIKDSLQDVRLDTIYSWHAVAKSERSSMKLNIGYLMDALHPQKQSTGLFTERLVNGRIVFERVNK